MIGTVAVVMGQVETLKDMDVAVRNGIEIMGVIPIGIEVMDSMAALDVATT
jgi:hypothetical protein